MVNGGRERNGNMNSGAGMMDYEGKKGGANDKDGSIIRWRCLSIWIALFDRI